MKKRNRVLVHIRLFADQVDYAKLLGEGAAIETKKSDIVDSIVERAIFKPELLNRFDDVVLFQPLSSTDMEKVGRLMLAKLNKRLDEKGVSVEVTD
ncbi:hypothetical protein EBX93_17140, partial [bacterium]|nr:hypothetical protein [bacterium]